MRTSWSSKLRSVVLVLVVLALAASFSSFSQAQSKRWKLKAEPLNYDEVMDPISMFKGTKAQYRCSWLRQKLNPYIQYINDAARSQSIPPRLLVAIIANELADIKYDDVVQDRSLYFTRGEYKNLWKQP